MLAYLTVILSCQLAGELLVTTLGLPVPGPVAGMVLLFAGLVVHGEIPKDLAMVADELLKNLSLLFVPAGVGIMLHVQLLRLQWLPISLALLISTLLTIAVTAYAMMWLRPMPPPRKLPPQPPAGDGR
jgi:holin-like protein